MRKVSGSMRTATPRYPRGANRNAGASAKRVGGVGGLVLLSILFWSIFYEYLPGNLGLNRVASQGTVSMASTEDASPANTEDANAANTLDRIIKVCTILMSVYVIATRWSLTRSLAKNINVGLAAFLVLAPLSAVWSIEPDATILRSISLVSIALLCVAISLAGWGRQRFQQLAIPPLMFILVASLVLGIIFPDQIAELGNDLSQKNAWHGIAFTKNQFGMIASMGEILCVNRWLAREGRTSWAIAGAAVAFACLILSRSNTSQFATIVAVLFMTLVMRVPVIKQRYSTHVAVAFAATILLYELVLQNVIPGAYTLLAPVRSLTGKDATFSARTIIWDVLKRHIQAAPYLGTGYGAYWIRSPTSPSYAFVYLMYFYPTEGHNGYLDIVNDLGFLGLICLLVFLFWFIRQALQLMRFDRSQAALYLALLFQEMVMNMSESEWFSRSSTFAVLFLATTCLSRGLLEVRLHTRSGGSAGR
jgi:exopolysaccharide production protein ExoQ